GGGGGAAHGDGTVGDVDVSGRGLEERGRRLGDLVAHLPGRHVDGAPGVDRTARGECPHAERDGRRIPAHYGDPIERNAESVGGDLGERRLVPLPLRAGARGDDRVPGRVEPYRGSLVRADGRALHVPGQPDAPVDAASPQVPLLCSQRLVADGGERGLQPRLEVAAVVDQAIAVSIWQIDLVRHVRLGEVVPPPQLRRIHGQGAGETVHDAVHGKHRLG